MKCHKLVIKIFFKIIKKYFFSNSTFSFGETIPVTTPVRSKNYVRMILTNHICPANLIIDFHWLDVMRIDSLSLTSVQKGSQSSLLHVKKYTWPGIFCDFENDTNNNILVRIYLELVGITGEKISDYSVTIGGRRDKLN